MTLDAPVVQGDGWDELKKGVAQHIGSANPGEAGNVVLSAHNDVYGELFRNLDKLQPGDQVILYSAAQAICLYRGSHRDRGANRCGNHGIHRHPKCNVNLVLSLSG